MQDCCKHCHDTGEVAGKETCPECLGLPESNCDGASMVCDACHGTGRKKVACPHCGHSH